MAIPKNNVETALKEAFVEIDRAVGHIRDNTPLGGWNQGDRMQEAAASVAPEWLQKWVDAKRWGIPCLTQGYEGFCDIADAYGYTEGRLWEDVAFYYYGNN